MLNYGNCTISDYINNAMPSPSLTLGFILATLFGAVFHLIFGGDARRLALFLLAGWIGFGLGHVVGGMINFRFLNIGSLYVLPAGLGAIIALIVAYALTSGKPRRSTPQ
jgi:hypothetical protein